MQQMPRRRHDLFSLAMFGLISQSLCLRDNYGNDDISGSDVEPKNGCSPGTRLTLYQNAGSRQNGLELLVDLEIAKLLAAKNSRDFGAFFALQVGLTSEQCDEGNGCRLFDQQAGVVESCSDVPPDGGEVWVVLPHRWFVFPSDELGRLVRISRIRSPRGPEKPIYVETISNKPRLFHLHNFLSIDEADRLVAFSESNTDPLFGLHRSTTGVEHQVAVNKHRTSENAFDVSSDAAMAVKHRALDLLGMNPYDERLTDGLQVLRYNLTTAYNSHVDYLDDNDAGHDYDSAGAGSNRFATILFYLSDVQAGGETVFPRGKAVDYGVLDDPFDGVSLRSNEWVHDRQLRDLEAQKRRSGDREGCADGNQKINNSDGDVEGLDLTVGGRINPQSWEGRMIRDCRSKLSVKPAKGHAILFYSQHPDGVHDSASLHGGCPVLNGTKWAANLWIWNKVRLGYPAAPRKMGAKAWNEKSGIGRDRLIKNPAKAEEDAARKVIFANRSRKTVKLHWGTQFFADLAPGQELSVNSFVGHKWNVYRATDMGQDTSEYKEGILKSWAVDQALSTQYFHIEQTDV